MEVKRRGFLGALAALLTTPWVLKRPWRVPWIRTPENIVFRGVTIVPDVIPEPEVFVGSFRLGVKTREAALSREALARVKACTRELEKWSEAGKAIDRLYTDVPRETRR